MLSNKEFKPGLLQGFYCKHGLGFYGCGTHPIEELCEKMRPLGIALKLSPREKKVRNKTLSEIGRPVVYIIWNKVWQEKQLSTYI